MSKEMIIIAETFIRADRAMEATGAFKAYCALGNYAQALQDAADEKGPWPEGPEPRRMSPAELAELDRLMAVRADAWADWSDLQHRAMRGGLTLDERTVAVRESTRKDQLGAMFSELVGMMQAARR